MNEMDSFKIYVDKLTNLHSCIQYGTEEGKRSGKQSDILNIL